MKHLFSLIVMVSLGCNQVNQSPESSIKNADSLNTKNQNISTPTTALPVKPLKALPSPFVIDSLVIADTALNYTAFVYFPTSKKDNAFNKSLKQYIYHEINLEKPENKTNNSTSFEMWLINLSVSETIIHALFRQQTYTEGSAHYNHSYLTFNYDPVLKKKIQFTDIFSFSKSKSKQSFCNALNGFVNGIDASDGNNDGLTPQEINKDLNFSVSNQHLIVYPNYCCANEAKIYTVNLSFINDYINPKSGKDFGLLKP
jgi:hypothetical protein